MLSFGMGRSVTLVRTNVSEERVASIFRVKIISELGTTLAVTINCRKSRRINHYEKRSNQIGCSL
jgi:hypothetical protein